MNWLFIQIMTPFQSKKDLMLIFSILLVVAKFNGVYADRIFN